MNSRAVYRLAAFSESERKTMRLIAEYMKTRGSRCFTYRKLRRLYNNIEAWQWLEWHTAERAVRSLAELGLLQRRRCIRNRRCVLFCVTSELQYLLEELGWLQSR